jgi:hypothetical protein
MLIQSQNWYLNFKLIFSNQKIHISIKNLLIDYKNGHFNFEYFYMNMKIHISTLKFCIKILNNHLIWTWNFNFNLLFWIFKINTSSLNIINWVYKWTFQFWILLLESENWHYNSGNCYLNSKTLFDLKLDI